MSTVDDLHKLAELKDRGIVTQQEFEAKKAEILRGDRSKSLHPVSLKKRGGLWWKIPLGIGFLAIIGNALDKTQQQSSPSLAAISSVASNPVSSSPAPSAPPARDRLRASMPRGQSTLISIVDTSRQQYASGANEMAKGASRPTRAKAICAAFPGKSVKDWVGQIKTLSTNGEGKGVLAVEIGPSIVLKTWNNSLSDIIDHTLIESSSGLFSSAVSLKPEQLVRFSGTFLVSSTDCFEESSMSLSGSIREPEFIFRFEMLNPL